jgi:hypothetical protein
VRLMRFRAELRRRGGKTGRPPEGILNVHDFVHSGSTLALVAGVVNSCDFFSGASPAGWHFQRDRSCDGV